MFNRNQTSIIVTEFATDLLTISLAWIVAYFLRFHTGLETPLGIPPKTLYFKLIPFIIVIWGIAFYLSGVYRTSRRQHSPIRRFFQVIQGCVLGTLSFIAFTYFYEEYRYSRLTLLVFAGLHPVSVLLGRRLVHVAMTIYEKKALSRQVLLIARRDSLRAALDISRNAGIQLQEIVGVILPGDDDRTEDCQLCQRLGLTIMEETGDWPGFFADKTIQSVIISLPHRYYPFLDEHLDAIADQVADVKVIPDVLRYTRLAAGIDIIGETPVIHLHESPLSGFNCVLKRSFDVAGSGLAIVMLSPIMLVIAAMVKLTSRGPVLYKQERMGLDGQRFQCLKFRTMPMDSEKETGAVWAKPGDSRATPVGSILRRTSLDELPQFFNVFKGDMSLVGPRPERPVFVNEFRKEVPGYMLRHKVKTGITGWAQVNGWRGNTSIHKRIECDLYYIQNWSIWLDFKILLLTIEEVFTGRNAY